MSSLLTNTSAMVALQTLKGINKGLAGIQGQISTGMKVSSAKDNASIWAIAQTMRSDVGGMKTISDSLATAGAAVGVARSAAETVSDLLTQMKEKIVAAQSDTADRGKIQADVNELRNQIASVVSSAQFNGLNLVNGDVAPLNVLASLDRDAAGNVTAGEIVVNRMNLSTTGTIADPAVAVSNDNVLTTATDATLTITGVTAAVTSRFVFSIGGEQVVVEGTFADGDAAATAIAARLDQMDGVGAAAAGAVVTLSQAAGDPKNVYASGYVNNGGMAGLDTLSVADKSSALGALDRIENLLRTAIDAAASFGSAQARIETQTSFIGKLTDGINTGIGALVDADMEEASARLQALQVQQQLGIQSLSIANQAPQSILALFR